VSSTTLKEADLEALFTNTEHLSRREWKTLEGKTIAIEKMDDSHLENAIKWQEGRGVVSVGIVARMAGRKPKTPEESIAVMEASLSSLSKRSYDKYLELLAEREWRRNTCGFNPTRPLEHLGSKSFPLPRTTKKP